MPPYGDSEEFSLTQSLKGLSYDDVTKYHNEDALIRGRREDVEQFLKFTEAGDGKKAEKIRTVALGRLLEFKRLRKVQEMANREVRMAKPVYSARNYNLPPIVLPPIDFGNAAAPAAAVVAGGAGGPSGGPSSSNSLVGGRRRQSRKTRSKSRKSRKSRSAKSRRSRN
jgi:hypothetical protein